MRPLLSSASALVALLAADIAQACPVCAAREEAGNLRWVALGALVLAPWIVALTVALYIRRSALEGRALPIPSVEEDLDS